MVDPFLCAALGPSVGVTGHADGTVRRWSLPTFEPLGPPLKHTGRIEPGDHRLETPVGVVQARLHDTGEVTVNNVPSYRLAHDVRVDVSGHEPVVGDVAWGGNWFFLVEDHGQALELDNIETLVEFTWKIRQALARHIRQ